VILLTAATWGLYGCVVGAQRPGVRANGQQIPAPLPESPEPAPSGSTAVWQPGYWHYDGSQYVWVPGRWVDDAAPLGVAR